MAQSSGLCMEPITSQHSCCVAGWARRKWSAQDVLLLHFGGVRGGGEAPVGKDRAPRKPCCVAAVGMCVVSDL